MVASSVWYILMLFDALDTYWSIRIVAIFVYFWTCFNELV